MLPQKWIMQDYCNIDYISNFIVSLNTMLILVLLVLKNHVQRLSLFGKLADWRKTQTNKNKQTNKQTYVHSNKQRILIGSLASTA